MAQESNNLRAMLHHKLYHFDPDATSLTDVGWVSLQNVRRMMIGFVRTVGTSTLVFNIIGNTAADGSGTDHTVKSITISAQPDADGDQIFAEIAVNEIAQYEAQNSVRLLGISAQMSFATATDEAGVSYVIEPKTEHNNLTADSVA